MKKTILSAIAFIILAVIGCKKTDSGGCAAWYEGADCQTEMRQKFYGVFKGTAYGPGGGQLLLQWTITAGTGGTNSIYFYGGLGTDGKPIGWNAVLTSSNTFDIPFQDMGNNNPLAPG